MILKKRMLNLSIIKINFFLMKGITFTPKCFWLIITFLFLKNNKIIIKCPLDGGLAGPCQGFFLTWKIGKLTALNIHHLTVEGSVRYSGPCGIGRMLPNDSIVGIYLFLFKGQQSIALFSLSTCYHK